MDPITAALIASSVLAGGSAFAKYGSDKAQAKGMVPDEWRDRLAELQKGDLGMTDAQRAQFEQAGAALRAGALGDAHAQQLRTAAAGAGSGVMNARDLFLQDVATQETQARMLNEQNRQLQQADLQIQEANRQMMMELEQRIASQEAAQNAAKWNLLGGLFSAGGAGVGGWAAGAQQQKALDAWMSEQAKNREAMIMASAYGGTT